MSWPTRITEAPISRCASLSVSITWRWTTTSSALVGSSAIITLGLRLIAIAMTTRCFMPPLSSWGNMLATWAGKPTFASRFAIRSANARLLSWTPWSCKPSAICVRTRITGLSEFIEPWATSAIRARRNAFIWFSASSSRLVSSNQILPETTRAGALSKRMIVSTMLDLPEPDSPTRPKRSWAWRAKVTASTA